MARGNVTNKRPPAASNPLGQNTLTAVYHSNANEDGGSGGMELELWKIVAEKMGWKLNAIPAQPGLMMRTVNKNEKKSTVFCGKLLLSSSWSRGLT